jgi:hypothetical protein
LLHSSKYIPIVERKKKSNFQVSNKFAIKRLKTISKAQFKRKMVATCKQESKEKKMKWVRIKKTQSNFITKGYY